VRYKFQIENGYIAEGNLEIVVIDHIAEIKDETRAMKHLIEAYGGQLVKEKKKKQKVNPVKWKEEVSEVAK
jgi:hypothetical protein